MLASQTRENSSIGRSYGFDLKQMLMSCSFINSECNSTNFTWTYSHVYGNCFTFNGGVDQNNKAVAVKEVAHSGTVYGLNLELYVGYIASAFLLL